ncbi:MAG: CBS domain-containing protein [Chitinophagales bacterium]|nr:CBS domain-containing protein [Chitinophagales bacterium]
MTAKQILDKKGRKVFFVHENAVIYEAVKALAELRIGLLLIKNDENTTVGVLSERDVVNKCVYLNKDPHTDLVKDIMTPRVNIKIAKETDTIHELMSLMNEAKIRHLPIVKNDELEGIVSIGDVLKAMLELKEFEIKSLSGYISGQY